jgi:hypothetical protein
MERRRRTGWTGGPRPQHASARVASRVLPGTFAALPSALLPASRQPSGSNISPPTPIKTAELNRQTRVFRNAVTHRKQRVAARSNRQKIKFCETGNSASASLTVSAFCDAFFAFLPGSAQYVKIAVTHSKQSTATFLPGSGIACKAPRKSSNMDTKLSEERAWLRL